MYNLMDWFLRLSLLAITILLIYFWQRYRKERKPRLLALGLFFLFAFTVGVDSLFIEPNILLVKRQPIILNKLNQSISIALISDTHVGPYVNKKFIEKMVKKIDKARPDLVLFAGDYFIEDEFEKYENYLDPLADLAKKYPVYAVLGNHEYGLAYNTHAFVYQSDNHEAIAQKLRSLGINILINETADLQIKNNTVHLIGNDELWLVSAKRQKRLMGLINESKKEQLNIVLAHNPDLIYELPSDKVDLFLAGHTHGGQIRLPIIGALGDAMTKLPKKFYKGLSLWDGIRMFVTSGIGQSGFNVRFFNPPQVDLLEIK